MASLNGGYDVVGRYHPRSFRAASEFGVACTNCGAEVVASSRETACPKCGTLIRFDWPESREVSLAREIDEMKGRRV